MRKPKPRGLIPAQGKQLTQKAAPEKRAEQIQAISQAQTEQIKKIAFDIASPSIHIRRYAGFALSKIGIKEATPSLIELLKSSDPQVRLSAAITLGKLGADAKEAVPKLTELLKDLDINVRFNAAKALEKIKAKKTAPYLKKRQHPAVKGLISKLMRPSEYYGYGRRYERFYYGVRFSTIKALGDLGADAQEAVPVLEWTLKTDSYHKIRLAVAEALEKITGRKYPV